MSTELQKNLALNIVKNAKRKKPLNKGQLVESVGYSKTVAEAKPQEIIDQKGVQDALNDYGFNVDKAKEVVGKIMNSESVDPNPRLKAADMIFEVHGSYAPTKTINLNLDVPISQEDTDLANKLMNLERDNG